MKEQIGCLFRSSEHDFSIAFDTFTQQVLTIQSDTVLMPNVTASVARSERYSIFSGNGESKFALVFLNCWCFTKDTKAISPSRPAQDAIYNGLSNNINLTNVGVSCRSGNLYEDQACPITGCSFLLQPSKLHEAIHNLHDARSSRI
jgi:hypothetical protein